MDFNVAAGWLSSVDLGTIPTENVVLVSALLSGYIAYQTRKNSLETDRERERYINFRVKNKTQFADSWGITVDHVFVDEDSGLLYQLKKFLFGTISGTSSVVVTYQNVTIPGSIWEHERMQEIMDDYDVKVEHIETLDHINPTAARFVIHSLDDEHILGFFEYILLFEKAVKEYFGD